MQSYALTRPPVESAGFAWAVDKQRLIAAYTRALRPFQGQTLSVGILEGKGPRWTVVSGTLAGCYGGGFLLIGPHYRTFINWLDIWTGHAVLHGDPGAAVASVKARLCGVDFEVADIV